MDSIIKVGIIGPKSYLLDGHDPLEGKRKRINGEMTKFLQDYLRHDNILVIGLTGLSLGVEQDFAEVCNNLGIDYKCYLPFENQEQLWSIPTLVTRYHNLLDKAIYQEVISEGNFSPRKILIKNKKIIQEASIIIYIKSSFYNNIYLDLIKESGTPWIEIEI